MITKAIVVLWKTMPQTIICQMDFCVANCLSTLLPITYLDLNEIDCYIRFGIIIIHSGRQSEGIYNVGFRIFAILHMNDNTT